MHAANMEKVQKHVQNLKNESERARRELSLSKLSSPTAQAVMGCGRVMAASTSGSGDEHRVAAGQQAQLAEAQRARARRLQAQRGKVAAVGGAEGDGGEDEQARGH